MFKPDNVLYFNYFNFAKGLFIHKQTIFPNIQSCHIFRGKFYLLFLGIKFGS